MGVDLVELFKSKTGRKGSYFYNIMPIENIPSVILNGILSFEKSKCIHHRSIAMKEVQIRRELVRIPNGRSLHSYANLYFTYHNPMMYKKSEKAETICVLVVDPNVLEFEGCVLSDRNAAADLVRFYTPEVGLEQIDFNLVFNKYWTHDNPYEQQHRKAVKCAEILIPDQVPYEYILGAYVVNETTQQNLIDCGFDKKIIVKREVFFR